MTGEVPVRALQGGMRDFRVTQRPDVLERCGGFFDWQDARRQSGTWPLSCDRDRAGRKLCAPPP